MCVILSLVFFFSSRRRHTRYWRDWSSDVCSSDLPGAELCQLVPFEHVEHLDERDAARAHRRHRHHLIAAIAAFHWRDRKSVVQGKSVDLGGLRSIKKK